MNQAARRGNNEVEAFPIKRLGLKLDFDPDKNAIITTITLRANLTSAEIGEINRLFELGAPLYAIIGSDQPMLRLDADAAQAEMDVDEVPSDKHLEYARE